MGISEGTIGRLSSPIIFIGMRWGMEKNVENFATKKIISAELPTIQQNILQI